MRANALWSALRDADAWDFHILHIFQIVIFLLFADNAQSVQPNGIRIGGILGTVDQNKHIVRFTGCNVIKRSSFLLFLPVLRAAEADPSRGLPGFHRPLEKNKQAGDLLIKAVGLIQGTFGKEFRNAPAVAALCRLQQLL